VLVDSSRTEYAVLPTVLRALEHCGIPFRSVDLSWQGLTDRLLHESAAVVMAQEHLASSIAGSDLSALIAAVQGGLGLVNLDFDLQNAPQALAGALGVEGGGAAGSFPFGALSGLGIRSSQHYITGTKSTGALTRTRTPLAYCGLKVARAGMDVLVESDDGAPALVAGKLGRGRIVQWAVSPRLWLRQYLGWTQGLDDLFWKAIVWVARKPFTMKAMPPYVRMRFDDCNGYWREARDLAFLEHFNARGHRPNVSLNVRAVTPDAAAHISRLRASGRADFAAHTLDANTSVWFKRAHGPYTPAEMRSIAQEVDAAFLRWGIEPSRVLSDHEHEFGHTALPYLRARGIRYKMNVNLPDERAEGLHEDWRPAPYGSMSYAFDTQPVSGMFVVFNHFSTFDHNRTYLEDGRRFFLNRTGGVGECKWDFLNGLTRSTTGRAGNDVEQAAQRLATHTARGLDSLFFGGSITHSHFIRDLAPAEWDSLLDRVDQLMSGRERRYASYDHIAAYAESKVNTVLDAADLEPTGGLACSLRGEATVPLELYCFSDRDEHTEHRFCEVPAFSGQQKTMLGTTF